MLRVLLAPAFAALFLLLAVPAQALPVPAPVTGVLQGSDGNFSFSVIHTSSAGSDGQSGSVLDTVTLGAGGGQWVESGALASLDIQLDIGAGTYDVSGMFDLPALADLLEDPNTMLGSLTFQLVAGADTHGLDGLTFYFEDNHYSSASLKPNSIQPAGSGQVLNLWGATQVAGSPSFVLGEALDLEPGGTGIDLRVGIGPAIPEPSARPLFMAGLAVVALGALRRRKAG